MNPTQPDATELEKFAWKVVTVPLVPMRYKVVAGMISEYVERELTQARAALAQCEEKLIASSKDCEDYWQKLVAERLAHAKALERMDWLENERNDADEYIRAIWRANMLPAPMASRLFNRLTGDAAAKGTHEPA